MVRLREEYRKRIVKKLMKQFNLSNVLDVPRLEKIVINVGLGEAVADSKVVDTVKKDLATITGQMPAPTRAKKPISNFRIRKGMVIGLKVTLRSRRMYEFFDRFVNFVSPRIRDFRGFSPDSFDGHGNYTLGLSEHTVFPEIEYDKVKMVFGMDITFVTTAKSDEEAKELFREFNFPFTTRRE